MIIGVSAGNSRGISGETWHHENSPAQELGPSPKELRRKTRRNCQRRARLQETKPMTRTTTKPMYSHRSWTVQPNEDGYGYDVVDRDGEPYDWAETLQDACQLCQKEA